MWYILTYSAVNKTYVKITNGVKLQYASYILEFFKINENIQITIVETTSKTRVFKSMFSMIRLLKKPIAYAKI